MLVKEIVCTRPDKTVVFESSDGQQYSFDVSDYIFGSWMGQLNDPDYFRQVKPYFGDSFEWPNGQAISPEDIEESSVLLEKCIA